ncbi:LysR family transcriptional regulator [Pseudomonas sp. GD03842]|uniref:LysR family transcriptional regulator n=1 Tax=unclassified Pseudomonas TaxID=196821 RepID=UPI000D3C6E45|nr:MULTISPECIES: LysR family transcriptional regulator [unclassified Pseudomonas]MDH0745509.1 LysR family transcriptional regulator [Pseudomonas sp. GD03842]RAU45110.1 LysR family transcriptional regulator [Pseudomonas sp. RIT 409]RAU51440.1 LysR family transcriptional regulator [Pseudomonas sp. RIT 412]
MKNSIQHIRAFLTVANTGSFAKAAMELNLSPSALTVQIQQLEEWLGVALLERSPRQVSLTAAGQNNRGPMEKLLLDLDNIVSGSRDLAASRRGVVTIAALPSLCAGTLAPILKTFRDHYPGVEVRLRDVVAQRIDSLVREGEVDFGLGVRARMSHGLDFQVILIDRLSLFVPLTHPLAQRRSVTLADIAAEPIILTGRDSSVRERVEQLFADAGLTLTPGLEANYMSTVMALVRQGLGATLLPESADEGRGDLAQVQVEHAGVKREIGLITRTGSSFSPAAQRFVETMRQALGAQAAP